MKKFVIGAVLLLAACFSRSARADQVSCLADGKGTDTCVVYYPDVLHAKVVYAGVPIAAGDQITATAAGCAQTGGSGKTWKRYLDPSGNDSDHLYHGLIQVPGVDPSPVRIQSRTGAVTARAAGTLTLGYEDDGYDDNGYWSHDDGTQGQCQDVNSTNHGRAFVTVTIKHASPPFAPAGTAYGQCVNAGGNTVKCHIDRPDVTHASEPYPAIQFLPGDQVTVQAQGCVQTGGSGKTWKRYVNPSGSNAGSHYHGLISIPGATTGLVYVKNLTGQTLKAGPGILTLGYEDDDYGDNGYWKHDDGTEDQCKGIAEASLDITITHAAMPRGTHVNLDGIEVVQSIQDMSQSVSLVAGKNSWARVYLSGDLAAGTNVFGTLIAKNSSGQTSLSASAALPFAGDALNARRTRWNGGLNFLLPASMTAAGTLTLTLDKVWTGTVTSTSQTVTCNQCTLPRAVTLSVSPMLRVRVFKVSYTGIVTATKASATFTPRDADVNLLNSWLARAYPTAGIQTSTASITSKIKPPFDDSTCSDVDSQLSGIRANDMSNGSVDKRTHYYGLVSDGAGTVTGGFMRGCSTIPDDPDPSATGSGPAGQGAFGDPDGSYADWYGGHELGHTFGRLHPGFCGESKDDANYPFPGGFISDVQGSFVALDFGDAGVDTKTGALLSNPPAAGATPVPRVVLAGTTSTEIMTYCAQPEWLSSYTYEAIREQLIQENAKNGGGSSGPSSGGRALAETSNAVQVVASVNLTKMTGTIQYVLPVDRAEPQPKSQQTAQLVVLDAEGKEISMTSAALRLLSERDAGKDQLALVNAAVAANPKMAAIQLKAGGKLLAEFKSSYTKPQAPREAMVEKLAPEAGRLTQPQAMRLRWVTPATAAIANGPVFYNVESSEDGKQWQTIAVGLTEPTLPVSLEQSGLSFRITAHNGFVKSDTLVLKGTGVRASAPANAK